MAEPSGSARSLPLIWSGAVEDPSGYADELRAYLMALEHEGVAVGLHDVRWTTLDAGLPPSQRAAIARARVRPRPAEFVAVYHLVPRPKLEPTGAGPTVIRTMFETNSVPSSMLARLVEVDEIWVPCAFNVETFTRGGVRPERLHVLPETLDFDLFAPPGERAPAKGPFTFLTSFDFTDRKGWDTLLDAWAEAFGPEDGVRLVLKCISLHGLSSEDMRQRVDRYLGGRRTAPVELDARVLPVAEMPLLYAEADAFVLASRGEGWGRPYMEAMAMGLPTIGSRWSGNLEFMHDGNSWLVDGAVVPVASGSQQHTPLYQGQSWFQPDPDALVAALREVAGGGGAVEARAGSARADLEERFGFAPTVARIIELTEGALARWQESRRRPLRCTWRGEFGSVHSLAVVNDALSSALEAQGDTALVRRSIDGNPVAEPQVGVAQQWPPVFEAPADGPFVLYQPWEFGEVPAAWVEPIRQRVDEVWTPSRAARESFIAAGVAPEIVRVVPNGVDLDSFSPTGPSYPLPTRKGTVFLFVGGATYRKGIDLLLAAYGAAFDADSDVSLVVKSFGATTVYRGQTAQTEIRAFSERPGSPELVLLEDDLAFEEIPGLYRAADCLVQPYRGEGFCLPALEALACGTPVIVTAGGPTDDFTSPACAWQLPARRVPLPPGSLPGAMAPAGGGFLLEPELDALIAALRDAADPGARADRASAARAHAERFSWTAAATFARERVQALSGRVPIRSVRPALLASRRRLLLAVDAEWDSPATWAPAVRAFAEAFSVDDDVTLVLPGDPALTTGLVAAELDACGADDADLADLVIANLSDLDPDSLALAADAYVCASDRRPARARRSVAAEPLALRTLLSS